MTPEATEARLDRPVVLRLVTRLNIGGPARQALLLTRALGDEFPTVLAAGLPPAHEGELSDPAVAVRRVPLTRRVAPAADAAALRATRRLLRQHKVQLLHTHMAKAGAVGRLAARTCPRRPLTVHTFHGHVLRGYFGSRTERAFLQTERWLARSTDLLLAVSPETRDELLDLGVGRPAQWHVLPVGLDLDPFLAVERPDGRLRRDLGLDPATPLVATVGRLVPIKDHDTLLRALSLVPSAHLAVVGDGELDRSLRSRAVELGIAGRVHFLGWRHDLPEVLSDCDVVALTSRNEGTPVALIEALAAGRPVVATDVGGVRHVVRDGETGLLAAPLDDGQIAAALTRILADRPLACRLGRTGRQDVSGRFGQHRLVAEVRAVYRELLASRGQRR